MKDAARLYVQSVVAAAQRHAYALLLCTVYLIWLLQSARSLGFGRDESFYFDAASQYARWLEAFWKKPSFAMQTSVVDGNFGYNHEHPSLMKLLFGLSELLLIQKWHLAMDKTTAFRLPGMLMGTLGVWITYRMGREHFGARAGLYAAAALAFMPRVFFHAHLACFDVPVMTMWLVSIYAYDTLLRRGGFWRAIWLGIAFGLTLETKHNAWMLPPVFVVHQIWLGLHKGKAARTQSARAGLGLVCMAILGPLVFVGLWPWLWHDTVPRIQEYVGFHLNHEYYNMEFLGRNYFGPPSPKLYAPLMIVATVPTVVLVLFLLGGGSRFLAWFPNLPAFVKTRFAKEHDDTVPGKRIGSDMILVLALLVPLAPFFLPKTPIFGGTKHWFPAYPFLAMFAGYGFRMAVVRLSRMGSRLPNIGRRLRAPVVASLTMAACVIGPVLVTAHAHPFALSAYVPIVGGTQGAATLGLNRQFWGFTTQSLAAYLDRSARRGERIYVHDTTYGAFAHMQEEKRIRADLQFAGSPGEADIAIIHHELHMIEPETNIWVAFDRTDPDFVLTHDGVPIISVYRRKR